MDGATPAPAAPIGPTPEELAHAIALYRGAMPKGELRVFDIAALDRIGMSVFVAAFAGEDGFLNDGFGYGATEAEALVGALGEITETAHVAAALAKAEVRVASYAALAAAGETALDPLSLCLPAGSDWTTETPVAWTRVRRWPDGAEAWAPVECVATAPGEHRAVAGGAAPLFRPITCGLGAGVSLDQALSHGVLELLQRDGNCTAFRAMDRGIAITLDRIEDPGLADLLARLQGLGISLMPKLASTEFGLVNLYVLGRGLHGGLALQQTACGEAVHANAERALRKALLEFVAARCRKAFMHGPLAPIEAVAPEGYLDAYAARLDPAAEEPRAMREMAEWLTLDADGLARRLDDTVYAVREEVPLSRLPSVADDAVSAPGDRIADLATRLGEAGIDIWVFDASPAGESGPRVVKAIAPGLEGETMSYYRIGERGAARLIERDHPIVRAEAGPARLRIRVSDAAETRLGGPRWLDAAEVDRIVGGAYPLYREPSSHAVRLAGLA